MSEIGVVTNTSRKNGSTRDIRRMMALERTAEIIGQAKLAAALDVHPRQLRAKMSADRPIHDADLIAAEQALTDHATAIMDLAGKLAALAAAGLRNEQVAHTS